MARMALEAFRGEATVAALVNKHGVHQTPIKTWERQGIEGMTGVFSTEAKVAAAEREGEFEKLHARTGQPVVERDFLAKASGRLPATRPNLRSPSHDGKTDCQ